MKKKKKLDTSQCSPMLYVTAYSSNGQYAIVRNFYSGEEYVTEAFSAHGEFNGVKLAEETVLSGSGKE